MDYLFEISERLIAHASTDIQRPQLQKLSQGGRMIGLKGARGVGKSTLLLQFAKSFLRDKKKLYISLDDIAFADQRLTDFADTFVKLGGECLLLDEVHSYKGWARELKNIYDRYPGLQVLFTGSSMLQLSDGLPELSRRAVIHDLPALSFREYLLFETGISFELLSLEDILRDHQRLSKEIWQEIRPLQHFEAYLKGGCYPYFFENPETYDIRLRETVIRVIESDLLITTGISPSSMEKIKQLLYIISHSVPFKPNIDKLAERMQIGKNNLKAYFRYLDMAGITRSLFSAKKGISLLTKPEKVYLAHPNLMHSLNPGQVNAGTQRESFFLSQLAPLHTVTEPDKADFRVDDHYLFEIGGKNETPAQIKGESNAYLAVDGIETGFGNRIPLWLFGFLY
ncbi:hypothetical protein CYPRO_0606 [Cyclonatronum proteinivorum]|uniref:AAA+ ATPase domain-containing protein n=1 Tax=Cyclonatronum proteinivorum TaxID=1457365 RepID=A0A345UHD9_9BACT|nr:AAA family ATPase [Cyclonatronum proteinivorum]AXI99890.1 hypothetical protein CYPRO_0606 [Cyclonatronum proteinivorum]